MKHVTYENFINNVLQTRGRHGCAGSYYETHHILPKCCGGNDNFENLIDLYAAEHFIAHKLLALENPNNKSLACAWWNMSSCVRKDAGERYECTPEEYEEARIAFSKAVSELQKGENNSFFGKRHTAETKQKISDANRGVNHPNYGKSLPDDVKKKISDANSGRIPSKETREKLSIANSLENNPMYGKRHSDDAKNKMRESKLGKYNGENNPMYGKQHSDETKQKISRSHIGQTHSEETKQKMSESRRGYNNPKSKMVFCIELNQYFASAGEASRALGIQQSGISRCCSGKQEFAGKHSITGEKLHWVFIDNTNNSLVA